MQFVKNVEREWSSGGSDIDIVDTQKKRAAHKDIPAREKLVKNNRTNKGKVKSFDTDFKNSDAASQVEFVSNDGPFACA